MRVLVVYDCLYPWTVGGAERFYRRLAERLAAEGHVVTFATRRQWDREAPPELPGVRVLAVSPRMDLYTADGRRRMDEAVVFGAGVFGHLLRHGRDYDVVHTASFPYFSLLAAAALRRVGGYRLVVDWHELWTRAYWQEYLGRLGPVGAWVQRRCVRVPQRAFCFAALTAGRLREEGLRGPVTVLEGQWDGPLRSDAAGPGPGSEPAPRDAVVFAGRLIREKRAECLPGAVAVARAGVPGLRGDVYGDGPERAAVDAAAAEVDGVTVHGFVGAEEVAAALRGALCLLLASRREGYGKVVIEAAQVGTPSVVVAAPDNAAVELVEDGVNGVVAADASAQELGAAIARVHAGGEALRASTAAWFDAHAERLSLDASLRTLLEAYAA